MTIDKTGALWRGEDLRDLTDYIRAFRAGGYPVAQVKESICAQCAGTSFRVAVDDDEGCGQRTCVTCGDVAFIADSAHYWPDASPGECACPCGGEVFAVGVGFALNADNEIRWISLGLRCLTDGTLGVYTDWKIDYSPAAQLFDQA